MFKNSLSLNQPPIKFGTDGWRGIIGVDFTLEKLVKVAIAAAQELIFRAPNGLEKKIIIGYDNRFLAREFAERVASVIQMSGV